MRRARRSPAHDGDVLVLSGDTPLLTPELLLEGSSPRIGREGAAATILSANPPDPRLYGRIVRDGDGTSLRIVEGDRRERRRS